jgi:hypothetical protein
MFAHARRRCTHTQRDALSAAFKFLTNEYGASYSIRRQYKAVADLLATSKRTHQLWYHALTVVRALRHTHRTRVALAAATSLSSTDLHDHKR